jgi:hypothetical protein
MIGNGLACARFRRPDRCEVDRGTRFEACYLAPDGFIALALIAPDARHAHRCAKEHRGQLLR